MKMLAVSMKTQEYCAPYSTVTTLGVKCKVKVAVIGLAEVST